MRSPAPSNACVHVRPDVRNVLAMTQPTTITPVSADFPRPALWARYRRRPTKAPCSPGGCLVCGGLTPEDRRARGQLCPDLLARLFSPPAAGTRNALIGRKAAAPKAASACARHTETTPDSQVLAPTTVSSLPARPVADETVIRASALRRGRLPKVTPVMQTMRR